MLLAFSPARPGSVAIASCCLSTSQWRLKAGGQRFKIKTANSNALQRQVFGVATRRAPRPRLGPATRRATPWRRAALAAAAHNAAGIGAPGTRDWRQRSMRWRTRSTSTGIAGLCWAGIGASSLVSPNSGDNQTLPAAIRSSHARSPEGHERPSSRRR